MCQFLNPILKSAYFLLPYLLLWSGIVSAQPTRLTNIELEEINITPRFPDFDLIAYDDKAYFVPPYRKPPLGELDVALWCTDGTPENTILIDSLENEDTRYSPTAEVAISSRGVFVITTVSSELWFTDRNSNSTQLIMRSDNNQDIANLVSANDRVFFLVEPNEIWVSDGSLSGTVLFAKANFCDHIQGVELAIAGESLYFSAYDEQHGCELWVSDGTGQGTRMVKDINPGIQGSDAQYFSASSDRLYFVPNSLEFGDEVWTSDGSTLGTQILKDIDIGGDGSNPSGLTILEDLLYFIADRRLWISDGSHDGTRLVESEEGEQQYTHLAQLVAYGESVYFIAQSEPYMGNELWKLNVVSGTSSRIEGQTSENSFIFHSIEKLFACQDELCFTARLNDGSGGLYRTKGDVGSSDLVLNFEEHFRDHQYPVGPIQKIITLNNGAEAIFKAWSWDHSGSELWHFPLDFTDYDSAGETETPSDETVTAIDDISQLKVYPNPAQDYLNLELTSIPEEISVLDVQGKYHYKGTGFSNNSVSIPTAGLKAGMYILIVDHQAFKFVKR